MVGRSVPAGICILFFLSTSKQSKLIPTVWHTVFRGNPVSWGRGKFTASGGRERKTRELRRRWRRWWEKTESGGRWGVELWVMTYWLLQDARSFHRLKPIGCEGPLCSVLRCRGQARSHLTFDLCYFLCVGAADHQAAQPDYIWAGVCAEQRKEGCVNGWCSHLTVTKEVPPTFGRFEAPLCDSQRSSWSLTYLCTIKFIEKNSYLHLFCMFIMRVCLFFPPD